MDSRTRPGGAAADPAADAARVGLRGSVFPRRRRCGTARRRNGSELVFGTRAANGSASSLRRHAAETAGRLLLLSPTVRGQRLQAAEPLSAMDGAERRD